MTTVLDFGSWKAREFNLVIHLLNKIKKKEYTAKFEHEFDWDTMKIGFNPNSGVVYLYDDNGNTGLDNYSSDDLIHLVDNEGQSIDVDEEVYEISTS